MGRFTVTELPIAGAYRVASQQLTDPRGHLLRVFCAEELAPFGWNGSVVQANITMTKRRGTVRGLHFQRPPSAEMKLVHCIRGQVWDVMVDLRAGSPTFLRWHAETLSADNGVAFFIPKGCAHGFQTLVDNVEMLYFHSASYSPIHEGGILATENRLRISWPLPITDQSERDLSFEPLTSEFEGYTI